jgi:hypothetical protein
VSRACGEIVGGKSPLLICVALALPPESNCVQEMASVSEFDGEDLAKIILEERITSDCSVEAFRWAGKLNAKDLHYLCKLPIYLSHHQQEKDKKYQGPRESSEKILKAKISILI